MTAARRDSAMIGFGAVLAALLLLTSGAPAADGCRPFTATLSPGLTVSVPGDVPPEPRRVPCRTELISIGDLSLVRVVWDDPGRPGSWVYAQLFQPDGALIAITWAETEGTGARRIRTVWDEALGHEAELLSGRLSFPREQPEARASGLRIDV